MLYDHSYPGRQEIYHSVFHFWVFPEHAVVVAQQQGFHPFLAVRLEHADALSHGHLDAAVVNTVDQAQRRTVLRHMANKSGLIRTYLTHGGKHIQFNVVDRAEMLDAQIHPEDHPELTVRVAGYSAYFTRLPKSIQDEVIHRTSQELA